MSDSDQKSDPQVLIEHKFGEAKFFLGNMEVENLRLDSPNLVYNNPDSFIYNFSAFTGALYSINDFLTTTEGYTAIKNWLDDDSKKQMYDILISREEGIRQISVHHKEAFDENDITVVDVLTMKTEKMTGKYGVNYVFAEKKSGNGVLEPPLLEEYRGEYTYGGRVYVPVTSFSNRFLYDVVHPCLECQGLRK
ncbi:hypothetical protein ACOZ4I_10755 [Haloarcula salina]|uniref:hypothetical protein n=1 Tax=Haloarcula salina TaxID=1429914 RepID=UPI003C6EDB08